MQLQLAMKEEYGRKMLNEMQTILIGGQAMDLQLEKQILDNFPNTRWIHTFGSTETASHFAGRILNHNTPEYTLTAGSSSPPMNPGKLKSQTPQQMAAGSRFTTKYSRPQTPLLFGWKEPIYSSTRVA